MLAIRTVLHPTDFSEHSDFAFRLAGALARDSGARLVVMHVWTPPPPTFGEVVPVSHLEAYYPEAMEKRLNQYQPPDPTVRVERRVEQGDPATEILRVARETNADLVVMGTHGRTGLGRLLMGSVAEQVVRQDIGALPLGGSVWGVGVNGRIALFSGAVVAK